MHMNLHRSLLDHSVNAKKKYITDLGLAKVPVPSWLLCQLHVPQLRLKLLVAIENRHMGPTTELACFKRYRYFRHITRCSHRHVAFMPDINIQYNRKDRMIRMYETLIE